VSNYDLQLIWQQAAPFFALKETPTIWGILNSPFLTAVIVGGVGLWIQKRVRQDIEIGPELQRVIAQTLQRSKELKVEPSGTSTLASDKDYRDEAKAIVDELKRGIDTLLSADPDQRHHRVYQRLGRYDYKLLAEALYERGKLYRESRDAIIRALSIWDGYARGHVASKPVTSDVLNFLQVAKQELQDDLSELR